MAALVRRWTYRARHRHPTPQQHTEPAPKRRGDYTLAA